MNKRELDTVCPKCGKPSLASYLFDNKCYDCINTIINGIELPTFDPTIYVTYDLYKHLCKLSVEGKL